MTRLRFKLRSIYAALLLTALLIPAAAIAQPAPKASGKLKVYVIDVEGGQSTLFVTPTGQSLLIDAGWSSKDFRDAERIAAAAKDAGISKIDYVLITHFHIDHAGGIPQLVARIPVGTFIDHGPNREFDKGATEKSFAAYQDVLATGKYKHILARPGDVLPITGIHATIVSADGNVLQTSLPGGGQPNPFCQSSEVRPPDETENARSVGLQITFGKLRLLDLGDLTWDREMQLVCPANRIGTIDVSIVSHHGMYISSSPALVDAIHARIAIMDNGERKGGSLPTFETYAKAPGLETLWQLHYGNEAGEAHNTAAEYIANPLGPDAGHFLEVIGSPDGSFDVLNPRTSATKHYAAR
jgi:competence protein ComEC